MLICQSYAELENKIQEVLLSRSDLDYISEDILYGISALFSPTFTSPQDVRSMSSPNIKFNRHPFKLLDSHATVMHSFDAINLPYYDKNNPPSSYIFQLISWITPVCEHNLTISVNLLLNQDNTILAEYTNFRIP